MISLLLCTDTGLARIELGALPDQTRIELLVNGLDARSKEIFIDSNGDYLDIRKWPGVKCGNEGNIVELHIWLHHLTASGSVSLDFLPTDLKSFIITDPSTRNEYCEVRGMVETSRLPSGLQMFSAENMRLSSTLDLPALPRRVKHFSVRGNQLFGGLVFSGAPQCLEHLSLSRNAFTGTLCTGDLPRSLRNFYISENKMTGSLDMTKLPQGLIMFGASGNNFCGTLNLSHLPPYIQDCYMSGNAFQGEISFNNLPNSMNSLILEAGQFDGLDETKKPKCVVFKSDFTL